MAVNCLVVIEVVRTIGRASAAGFFFSDWRGTLGALLTGVETADRLEVDSCRLALSIGLDLTRAGVDGANDRFRSDCLGIDDD